MRRISLAALEQKNDKKKKLFSDDLAMYTYLATGRAYYAKPQISSFLFCCPPILDFVHEHQLLSYILYILHCTFCTPNIMQFCIKGPTRLPSLTTFNLLPLSPSLNEDFKSFLARYAMLCFDQS